MSEPSTPWELSSFLEETNNHALFAGELGINRQGPPDAKIVLVLGPNGSGKSLFRRWVTQTAQASKVRCFHLSMSGRSAYMASMVYGDESRDSTGNLSSHVVTGGLRTCRSNTDKQNILFLDEPDVGASHELCAGMGRYITTQLQADPLPEATLAVFIVTHSEHLVRELLPLHPQVVFLGASYPSLEAWMARPIEPVLDLEAFADECHARFLRVQEFMKKA